ncbi:hypothetical protein CSUB_C0407 [Candidatus Caldarchaeum subterraneum]|uniref:Uncharacterized protein n=1 Tax=Caldiarchaeum subterraneum TaxID=311458 RepID=E6N533_CALS0|nr:hypothetical protein HGMM_F29F08C11 [Candidatus Caldarchaeum subterraneum]BAJ49249.1 hypothetical protein HGMM_F07G12C17 [Candidatus Caldarchaeum subterraneum]BAJ50268.1 hypothetical protein CSUB_C0407 [Candidatus Caldarchaeum subterraneum]
MRLNDDSGSSAAGPAVDDKGESAKEVGRRFYADIHRKKDDSGYRITYTTDGEAFKHVDSPTKIPAEAGDKVYVDVIPVMHIDGFIELLRRGAEVHYLRRLTLIKQMRKRLGIESKSAKTDVRILMNIEEKWFKRVDEDFLAMRQLISPFRRLERTKQRLENQYKDVPDVAKQSFKRLIDHIEEEKLVVARPIIEEAERRYPLFKLIAEELGLTGDSHLLGRQALAELLTYVDFSRSFTDVRIYLGLFRQRINNQKYNHIARKALNRLTMSITNKEPRARDEEEIAFKIWLTYRRGAQ